MKILFCFAFSFLIFTAYPQSIIPGYHSKITGEDLNYHAPQPDAPVSLLVRSEDSTRFIEWESSPLPGTWNPEPGTFLLLAGIDVNPADPHSWKVFVNDREMFTISSPLDTIQKVLTWQGPDGANLEFRTKEVDKYGDFMGYLYCKLPGSMLEAGKPVRFKVVGESAGSRTWFMVFKYETVDHVKLIPEQAVMKGEKGNSQVLKAEIVRFSDPVEAKITVAGQKLTRTINFGYNYFYLPVPQINQPTSYDFVIKAGKQVIADETFMIEPVKQRTIYLLHHSHNDIGYTHVQTEVEQMQWENLEDALKLISATKDFPPEAQMKYCTEVMWAVESWYAKASTDQKKMLQEAVSTGHIELNGLFANELVSLLGPEELDRLLEAGRTISKDCGVELTTAMITDIPGWSWALVPALANSGVKYLSLGTNRGHRIGDIIEAWGDKPFYWVSPSGDEKVLCWVHGEGYSLFHTGLAYSSINKRLQEDLVFSYMKNLEEQDYPYEEVMLRYNIGSDNGPVDPTLPKAVMDWNEKYVTPKIVISTVNDAFLNFEEKHGKALPQVAGDITCYWEDGAYSTTRETIRNRRNASRLVQAQALWAMFNPAGYKEQDIKAAWRNVLLFDEHTWGSWNSISEPEVPFTIQQWEIKKSFVDEAEKQSKKLYFDALISKVLGGPAADAIEVINPNGWQCSSLINISGGKLPAQMSLIDENGAPLPLQILSDGSIAFMVQNVPPLSSKIFKITQTNNNRTIEPLSHPVSEKAYSIETKKFSLSIDKNTGAISSLIRKQTGADLVDRTKHTGLNEFLYVYGRNPEHPQGAKLVNIKTTENGPLLYIIKLEYEAPGCKGFTSTIRIMDDLDQVEISNTLDRKKEFHPEAVHFAFPFNVPDGIMRFDLASGICQPEKDQLPGSNKNYLAMENWLDISNDNSGVTFISPDIPLFEAGNITMDEIVYGWVDSLPATQTFYSYVMNNYWETNYAASQEGLCTFRYVIKPHDRFYPSLAEREALLQRQPLLTRKGGGWQTEKKPLIELENPGLLITTVKPIEKGVKLLVTVQNTGTTAEIPRWSEPLKSISLTDPDGIEEKNIPVNGSIPPGGIRYFKFNY